MNDWQQLLFVATLASFGFIAVPVAFFAFLKHIWFFKRFRALANNMIDIRDIVASVLELRRKWK